MFYYIEGTLVHRDPTTAVIDCGGVGYRLTISYQTSDALADKLNTRTRLMTYLKVSEDGVELFGFSGNDERDCFLMLIGVSGVGPKAAMSILSVMTPDKFRFAVCTEDTKGLAKAPNIGSKTAARIILELRDKISKDVMNGVTTATPGGATVAAPVGNGKLNDALEALMALGYDRSTALNGLKGLDAEKLSVSELIAAALKKFI